MSFVSHKFWISLHSALKITICSFAEKQNMNSYFCLDYADDLSVRTLATFNGKLCSQTFIVEFDSQIKSHKPTIIKYMV